MFNLNQLRIKGALLADSPALTRQTPVTGALMINPMLSPYDAAIGHMSGKRHHGRLQVASGSLNLLINANAISAQLIHAHITKQVLNSVVIDVVARTSPAKGRGSKLVLHGVTVLNCRSHVGPIPGTAIIPAMLEPDEANSQGTIELTRIAFTYQKIWWDSQGGGKSPWYDKW
jgi:hypothetical protein